MSEKFYIGKKAQNIENSPAFAPYSKVVLQVTEELAYMAGDDTGRTLTVSCPWGSQEMADNILDQVKGYVYQPLSATNTRLDPAAELGDGVTVGGVYGGIFVRSETYGRSLRSDIEAPADEEIDHEYPYLPPQERAIRQLRYAMKAELKITVDAIEASVSKKVDTAGGESSSFGWKLTDSDWTLSANGSEVLKVNKDGLVLSGTFSAGTVGNCTIDANGNLRVPAAQIDGTLMASQINTNGLKVNAADITGTLTASQINTTNLHVSAANIDGKITASQIEAGAITVDSIYANKILNANGSTVFYSSGGNYQIRSANLSREGDPLTEIYADTISFPGTVNTYMTNSRVGRGASGSTSYVTWQTLINNNSDERLKKDIEILDERYEVLFDGLAPKRYKYIDGTSDRYHTGFIVQDILSVMEQAGLESKDLAAIVLEGIGEKDEHWAMRRDELVSLNTWQIQRLKSRVKELEEKVSRFEMLMKESAA